MLTDLDTQTRLWAAALGWPGESLLRLALAAVAGGLIGLEREMRGRQAGFRTNLLVCMGSALVMLVSIEFARYPWKPGTFNINVDPARIAYSVMTGVGFLGAGTIIKHGASVRGLTTGAAMWCVAAVGLSAGFGMYLVTILATILIVAALWLLQLIEQRLPKKHYRNLVIRRPWRTGCVDETIARFRAAAIDVVDVNFQRHGDLSAVEISLHVGFSDGAGFRKFERELEQDTECQLVASRDEKAS
jgi:putative Mg2+ transporter-C (MgtC) family protein